MLHEETYIVLLETICKIMSMDITDQLKLRGIEKCIHVTVEALEEIVKERKLMEWGEVYA